MKIAIMQPYFFPYIGYWQLMNAVDRYVIFNDVNFIKKGWINRNRILCQGRPQYINILLNKASQNKKINEIEVIRDSRHIKKLLHTLEGCYSKAPHFKAAYELISSALLDNPELGLDRYLLYTIKAICSFLDITTPLILSSEIPKDESLHGQQKIIHICQALGADDYYNPIGGQQLYNAGDFLQHGIKLNFLYSEPIQYQQFKDEFQPNLSIIDLMMFCPKAEIRAYLKQYSFIKSDGR